jgi:DNA uptake protein ComE-like DNA-binding protein
MQKWITSFKEHLKGFSTFNYAERRGIAILISLILMVEVFNAFFVFSLDIHNDGLHQFQHEFDAFQAAIAQADTLAEKKKIYPEPRQKKYPNRYSQTGTAAVKPPMVIEINTADSAMLVRLRGIGPVFADRILKYRGLLGGYVNPIQLLEVYGMDSSRYHQIEDKIRVDPASIQKIAVNRAEFKQLLRHPYLDYETVKDIFNYRQRSGPILNADSLRKVIAYDPMFEKISPYILYD